MVKETVRKSFQKMKKEKIFISLITDSDENTIDCEVACDCIKRANGAVHTEIHAETHTVAHNSTSAQRMTYHDGTSNNRLWSP